MTQNAFTFVPLPGESLNFARLGFDLDWKRIHRRTNRLFAAHLAQAAEPGTQAEVLVAGFDTWRHFLDASLFEEVQLAAKRKARAFKRAACQQGRRRSGALALACTQEGRRMQLVITQLSERLRAWEAASLCG